MSAALCVKYKFRLGQNETRRGGLGLGAKDMELTP